MLWLIAAGVLAIAEMLSLDLALIMCAGAALVAAGSGGLGAPAALQFIVFAVSALGLLFVVRPAAKRHLTSTHTAVSGIDTLIGKDAVVLNTVDAHEGLVKLLGERWTARSYDPTQVLEVGRTVKVMEIRGAIAVVWGEP